MGLNNQSHFILRIITLFLGMLVAVTLMFNDENVPKYFAIIPSMYSILIFIFPKFTKYIFEYVGLFALNLSMFIRYLLTPFLISFYGFEKSAILIPTETSFNIAINLMLYELIIIFLLFQFTYKKIYKPQNTLKQNVEVSGNFWNCIIIIISIIIVFIYPEILSRYAFIFNANELKSKKLEIEIISFLPLIVQLGFLTLTMTLVNYFYKKYNTNENKI